MASSNANNSSRHTEQLAVCAIFTALLCVLAPVSIPIGPVPITLATFLILLSADLLGWKGSAAAVAAYLVLGFAGLPVFSNWQSGAAPLMGPTGGYLVGYLPMAILAGIFAAASWPLEEQGKRLAAAGLCAFGMVLGTACLYVLGTVWFCVLTGSTAAHALAVCVVPFLPLDALKIAGAAAAGLVLRPRLRQAGARNW